MISAVLRTIDSVLGRGEAAITVPPLDGALRPNRMLDDAAARYPLEHADCLAVLSGKVLVSAGDTVYALTQAGRWRRHHTATTAITCMASVGDGGLAVGLADGTITVAGGAFDGRRYDLGSDARCLTAMTCSEDRLFVANGSATNPPDAWRRDLMEQRSTGSIWVVDLESGRAERIASQLAWPAGLEVDRETLIASEAWRHRLIRIDPAGGGDTEPVLGDLPGYPGRLSKAPDGWWLSVFAPRSQLIEFILREPIYRRKMIAEVPQDFWIAPSLRSGRSFYEPLQGGGVKHLGLLKPWAPALSAGLCIRLDAAFQPQSSLQSRADGVTHGVTGAVESGGRVFVAARGDGVVVAVDQMPGGLGQ